MRAFPLALPIVLALAACSSVTERAGCAVSTDCPAGEYCARTPDGNVCWPDAVPPGVSGVTVSCAAPCLRDGVLHVEATIADDLEVLGADVSLDVGGAPVPMARVGAVWAADVALRRVPFDHFVHGVVARVTARDGARNEASADASAATTVTRLRFSRSLDAGVFGLGHPAVMQDGTVVTAGTNGKVYFVPWDGGGVSSTVAVGTGQISAAPLVLGGSVWIGSEDNRVYELGQGAVWAVAQRANTGGPVRGSLAALTTGEVIAASDAGVVFAVTSSDAKNGPVGAAFTVGAVVDAFDNFFAVAAGSARRFRLQAGFPSDSWATPTALGGTVADPLACTTALIAMANTGADGLLKRVSASGDPQTVATTTLPSGGVAILSDGSIVVPEQTKTLSRWTSAGASFPGWQRPDLGGATRTPLVLASPSGFVVPTAKGLLHALRPDGSIAWSGQLGAGTASLQPGNIYTPPGQPSSETLSTAYFAGSDGVLHAVIIDGRLDPAAPWPKAFHDPRNTNRAGSPP